MKHRVTGHGWFAAAAVAEGVTRLTEPGLGPLHGCNCWLIEGRDAALLVDAGTGVASLAPVVARLTVRPVVCLVTHAHYDHMGGAHDFSARWAHPAEAAALSRPTPETTGWQGWLDEAAFLTPPPPGFSLRDYAVQPAPPTRLVADGDRVDLGGRVLQILHLPGHSPGLLAAYEPASGLLFSSDALYDGRMFFNLPGSDHAAARRSLARIAALPVRTLHPGHFASVAGGEVAAMCAAEAAAISG